MKTLFFALILSFNSFALDGITIGNAFQVDKDGNVFRGKEPKSSVDELAHFGISDVIIYKNQTKDEVDKEIVALRRLGIKHHHVPFRWKEYPSMIEACEQTIEALNVIKRVKAKNGKVFFHCTAGEDRTGMLAGVYRMLEENISATKAFREEMCARGYSDGNRNKPALVTSAIQKELTPLFIAIAEKIESGELKYGRLSKTICKDLVIRTTKLKCR